MGITKLDGIAGEAVILGSLRQINWVGGTLTIQGLTDINDMYAVLDALHTDSIPAVRVRTTPKAAGVQETAAVQAVANGAVKAQQLAQKAQESAEKAKAAAAPALAKEAAKFDEGFADGFLVGKEKEPAAPAPVLAMAPPPPAEVGDIPEKILKSTRFVEVFEWMVKAKGLQSSDVDAIVPELEKLRDTVKVIGRVRDIRDKVKTTLAAYAEAGEAPAPNA